MKTIATEPASFGALDELIGYSMRRASARFAADFSSAVAGTGIRQALLGILSIVIANPGINQSGAARALGIQRGNMVSLVDELVDTGLITRQVVIGDRRAFALYSTAAGYTMLNDCVSRIRDSEDRLLKVLSHDERAVLIALLERIEQAESRRQR